MEYPEHKKLEIFSREQQQALNEFIEYLDNVNNYLVIKQEEHGGTITAQQAFYKMLNVDPYELEQERKQMLKGV